MKKMKMNNVENYIFYLLTMSLAHFRMCILMRSSHPSCQFGI